MPIFCGFGGTVPILYVDAKSQVVIAKASTWPQAWDSDLARDAFATVHAISVFLDQQPAS